MKRVVKKDIERVLRGNGWIAEDIIARKLDVPFMEVDKILKDLERDGLVESRLSK